MTKTKYPCKKGAPNKEPTIRTQGKQAELQDNEKVPNQQITTDKNVSRKQDRPSKEQNSVNHGSNSKNHEVNPYTKFYFITPGDRLGDIDKIREPTNLTNKMQNKDTTVVSESTKQRQ